MTLLWKKWKNNFYFMSISKKLKKFRNQTNPFHCELLKFLQCLCLSNEILATSFSKLRKYVSSSNFKAISLISSQMIKWFRDKAIWWKYSFIVSHFHFHVRACLFVEYIGIFTPCICLKAIKIINTNKKFEKKHE